MNERVSFPTIDTARLTLLRLGEFVLHHRIGVGGMSEVWQATHGPTGAPVAVKLLATRATSVVAEARAIEALRQEITLLARLDHPGILRILEFGTVTRSESNATEGMLPAGSPYLVTPWARTGSLDRAPPLSSYDELEATLLALLRALAHAHARGVVHRDLKPANVLMLGDPTEGPVRPVLSDFGIAFALARAQDGPQDQLGTPSYMSPEQILGPPLEQGPTTDLYALGCLAYRLATGRAPFSGGSDDVLRSHVLVPTPPMRALFAVPEQFADWALVLLAKQPHQRFPSAAAARRALEGLRGSARMIDGTSGPHSLPPPNRSDAMTAPHAFRADAGPTRSSSIVPGRTSTPSSPDLRRARLSSFPRTKPPASWRDDREPSADVAARSVPPRPSLPDFDLVGAGLGLFSLRRFEVAGRERERDRLYETLVAVEAEQRPRAIVLRGAQGMGTTRLAEWLLETASELDVGAPVRITLGETHAGGDGVAEVVERLVGVRGLAPAAAEGRARAWARDAALTAPETADLLALLGRTSERFAYPSERMAAARMILGRGATRVPLVVLFDDGPLEPGCLELVRSTLEADDPAPLCFVITASDELLDPSDPEGERRALKLASITSHPHATEVRLGPLTPDEHAALVEKLIGLETSLAREVIERTEGNPLFAMQLVGDWVSRGLLEPGMVGFAMREGATAEIPDGIFALYEGRLREAGQAIARRSSERDAEEALIGLELAAMLSPTPLVSEWHAVLDRVGVRAAHALPELAMRGLVRTRSDRFVIGHRMLRESLVRRAREAGREVSHHRAIAEVLEEKRVDPSRVAAHHLAANQDEHALLPLLRSAELRCARGDMTEALDAVRRFEAALDRLAVPKGDARRARSLMLRAEILGHVSMLDEATACLDAVVPQSEPAAIARMAWLRGIVAQKRGDATHALEHFEIALTTLWSEPGMSPEDRELEPRALYGVAEAAKLIGDLERAHDAYDAVQARTDPSHRLTPLVLTGLSDLENRRGNGHKALVLGHQALELLETRGARLDTAITRNALGDIERRRGQLREAEHHYRIALSIMRELGTNEIVFVRMNLALVAMAENDFARVEEELRRAEALLSTTGREAYLGLLELMRLPVLAARGDAEAVESTLERRATLLRELIDPDLAWCLERAALVGNEKLPGALSQELERQARAQRARLG